MSRCEKNKQNNLEGKTMNQKSVMNQKADILLFCTLLPTMKSYQEKTPLSMQDEKDIALSTSNNETHAETAIFTLHIRNTS